MSVLASVVFTLLFLAAPIAFAQDVSARFYPEKQEYLVGEPIIIVLEVTSSRQQAIIALAKIANLGDCDAMLKIAAENVRVTQEQAYVATGRICGDKAVAPLVHLLPGADAELAWNIATGLGGTGSRNAVQPLVDLLLSPNDFVRRDAYHALFTLTHRGDLRTSQEFPDPKIYSEWRSWWAVNSRTAPIFGLDECPK
jgi:hypothetical protein